MRLMDGQVGVGVAECFPVSPLRPSLRHAAWLTFTTVCVCYHYLCGTGPSIADRNRHGKIATDLFDLIIPPAVKLVAVAFKVNRTICVCVSAY